jgi:chemotaxis protein MotB
LNDAGQAEMAKLAQALKQLEQEIPDDIAWVLRVDGHTDSDPVSTAEFKSNWELSAKRAISVVNFLEGQGVQSKHLVAAGFGEFQPLVQGDTEDAKSENRRIELKLTER